MFSVAHLFAHCSLRKKKHGRVFKACAHFPPSTHIKAPHTHRFPSEHGNNPEGNWSKQIGEFSCTFIFISILFLFLFPLMCLFGSPSERMLGDCKSPLWKCFEDYFRGDLRNTDQWNIAFPHMAVPESSSLRTCTGTVWTNFHFRAQVSFFSTR